MKSHGFPRNSIYVSGGFSSCQCWCTWAIYSLVQKMLNFSSSVHSPDIFCLPKRLPIAATVPEKCRNDRPFPCPVSGRSSSVSALNSSPAGTLPKSPKTLISSGWKTCNVGFLGISGVFVMDELIFFFCVSHSSLEFLIAMWLWFQTMESSFNHRGNLVPVLLGIWPCFRGFIEMTPTLYHVVPSGND